MMIDEETKELLRQCLGKAIRHAEPYLNAVIRTTPEGLNGTFGLVVIMGHKETGVMFTWTYGFDTGRYMPFATEKWELVVRGYEQWDLLTSREILSHPEATMKGDSVYVGARITPDGRVISASGFWNDATHDTLDDVAAAMFECFWNAACVEFSPEVRAAREANRDNLP